MVFDPGATVNCQRTSANCYDIRKADVSLATALQGKPATIGKQGLASVVVIDEDGKQQVLQLGRTLIDPQLKNLLSASAMFKGSDEVFSVWGVRCRACLGAEVKVGSRPEKVPGGVIWT